MNNVLQEKLFKGIDKYKTIVLRELMHLKIFKTM
jgi:hypothetical protein